MTTSSTLARLAAAVVALPWLLAVVAAPSPVVAQTAAPSPGTEAAASPAAGASAERARPAASATPASSSPAGAEPSPAQATAGVQVSSAAQAEATQPPEAAIVLTPGAAAVPETPGDAAVEPAIAAPASATPEPEPEDASALRLEVFGGAGVGTRTFERPVASGVQRLESAVFPAVEVGLVASVCPSRRLSLVASFHYQTSVGLEVEERPPFALPNHVAARAERAELMLAPTLRVGTAVDAPTVAVALGAFLRAFVPDEHGLTTPAYHLAGPQMRAEVSASVMSRVRVVLAPELAWVLSMGDALTGSGIASTGVAVGGAAGVAVELDDALSLELSYRQAHALASNEGVDADFEDVERFATARLKGVL